MNDVGALEIKWTEGENDALREQSHGDFPIFFVTSLINSYQSILLIHELLLGRKGTILNEFSKEKTSQN